MKFKLFLSVLCLFFVLSGCNSTNNNTSLDKSLLKQKTSVGDITLSSDAEEYSISSTDKIVLTITGQNGEKIHYNSKLQVQIYDDGEWKDVTYYGGVSKQISAIPDQETGLVSSNYTVLMEYFDKDMQTGIYKLTLTIMDEPMSVTILISD